MSTSSQRPVPQRALRSSEGNACCDFRSRYCRYARFIAVFSTSQSIKGHFIETWEIRFINLVSIQRAQATPPNPEASSKTRWLDFYGQTSSRNCISYHGRISGRTFSTHSCRSLGPMGRLRGRTESSTILGKDTRCLPHIWQAGVLPMWTGVATAAMATGHGPEKLSTSRFIGHTRVNVTISRLLSIADS